MEKKIITLRDCKKSYTYDQDKACSPEETVARFKERLSTCGLDVLKEVQRIDTGRLDIPVYFSVCGKDALETIGTKKQMGKGSTPEQSQASACMELAERFSFFSFLKQKHNFITGDYNAMQEAGYPVLPLETLLQSVHDTNTTVRELSSFLSGLPMQWTWARNISRDKEVLVPFSWFFAINEFNGPSAGNTYEEATLQGISEVVERHVCALVTKNRTATPGIDPRSVTHPVARALLAKFADNGIQLFLNDYSLDTGMPTVAALAYDPATFPQKSEIVYTAGTTPDPDKALIRALTEVAQLAGDFESGSNYVASGLPKPRNLDEVDFIIRPETMIHIDAMTNIGHEDMLQEVKNSVAALDAIGLDVLLIDTTHPSLQIPAIYTIIPGCHFRERAAGGNAALFAAKLAFELLDDYQLHSKLEQMRELAPEAYYVDFYQGRSAYDNDDISGALDLFSSALTKNPQEEDIPYLYSYLGACLRDQERWTEAVDVLSKGRSFDDERPDIHNMLGVCYFKLNRFQDAVTHFTRAVKLNPVSAIDYANLALNQERLGHNKEAVENYQIALAMDPEIAFAAERLANLLATTTK